MEMEQIVKILIFVVVLIVLVGAVMFLLKGRGGGLLDSLRSLVRLGR